MPELAKNMGQTSFDLLLHTQEVGSSNLSAPTTNPSGVNAATDPSDACSGSDLLLYGSGPSSFASSVPAITIPLSRGLVALVDHQDEERVRSIKWSAVWSGWHYYAANKADGEIVYLHRFILGVTDKTQVDHRNLDGLDCRRKNLRLATPSQNGANKPKQKPTCSSSFKGVDFHAGGWRARIRKDRKQISLGTFKTAEDAARAYDSSARKLHGEFARCNFAEAS